MYAQLFKEIKSLTKQAIELIENDNIEKCNLILVKRQTLLEELEIKHKLSSKNPSQKSIHPESNETFTQRFIELMIWIQQHDHPAIINVKQKQQQNKERSISQVKTKKALHQYTNLI